jgi:paraquat-inducible protein A
MSDVIHQQSICKGCGQPRVLQATTQKNNYLGPLVLTALFLYIPAMFLPFMTIEINGIKNTSTIFKSVVTLSNQGSWFIAIIVLVASIVIPVIKLVALFYLGSQKSDSHPTEFHSKLLRFVEFIGKWSMLDVFLLALMVTILKLKPWMDVTVEPGALFFAMVVIFTMLASQNFAKYQHSYNH